MGELRRAAVRSTGHFLAIIALIGLARCIGPSAKAKQAKVAAPTPSLYVADFKNNQVKKIDANGLVTVVAGNGHTHFAGDGESAISAEFNYPLGITTDGTGDFFIADTKNHRIRKINANGTVQTVVGTGVAGYSGDNGLATYAQLDSPQGVALDSAGNLYIADTKNNRIRMVSPNGVITTVAGVGGLAGFGGDKGPATSAKLALPTDAVPDSVGNFYISDTGNQRVRMVNSSGIITTVAGTGVAGFGGDNGKGVAAKLNAPLGLWVDASNDLYIADSLNHRVRKISTTEGLIFTAIGKGTRGFSGDEGLAKDAELSDPAGITGDHNGNIYVADLNNHRVRKINREGKIVTFVGTGEPGYSGDSGAAKQANIQSPRFVLCDPLGTLFVSDFTHNVIRSVSAKGVISTFAGAANAGFRGDFGPAKDAELNGPTATALDRAGNLYISDSLNHRIRKVNANGVITTFAGNGRVGFTGDNGTALEATLSLPQGLATDSAGNLFVADSQNNVIRKISASGIISTYAGNGTAGSGGDNGPATTAELANPTGLSVDSSGNLYIADTDNHRIRKVAGGSGIITTVAGSGIAGYSGDLDFATSAELSSPESMFVDASGNVYVADTGNGRIRKVDAHGKISTIGGNGTERAAGDGGPASEAALVPFSLAADVAGNLLVADSRNHRIRQISSGGIISSLGADSSFGQLGSRSPASAAEFNYPLGLSYGLGP